MDFCGERGIRTPGTSQFNGFQDRRNRPLCHLSRRDKSRIFFLMAKPFIIKKDSMAKKNNE
jgi:DNA mismatch repair protein MutS2